MPHWHYCVWMGADPFIHVPAFTGSLSRSVEAVILYHLSGHGFEIKRVNKYSQSCPHTVGQVVILIHCQVYFGSFRNFSRIVSVNLWLYRSKPSRQDRGTPRLLSCREEKVFFTCTICWRGIILPLRPPLSLNPHFLILFSKMHTSKHACSW